MFFLQNIIAEHCINQFLRHTCRRTVGLGQPLVGQFDFQSQRFGGLCQTVGIVESGFAQFLFGGIESGGGFFQFQLFFQFGFFLLEYGFVLNIQNFDDVVTVGRLNHVADFAFLHRECGVFKFRTQATVFRHKAQIAAVGRRGGVFGILFGQCGEVGRLRFYHRQHFFGFRFGRRTFFRTGVLRHGEQDVSDFAARRQFVERLTQLRVADSLFVGQCLRGQRHQFDFHGLRDNVVFFVGIVVTLQYCIVDFNLSGKGFRIERYRTYGACRLRYVDQLRSLRITDDGAVLYQVLQILEQKLVADFFNKLVFAHTALIEILGQQRLAELAVCIVEARVVHDNLLNLFLRYGDAHLFRTLGQIRALQQRLEHGVARLFAA